MSAYLTILAEVGGGLALVLGVATRLVALATVPILIGASYVHFGAGWLFANDGGGWGYPVFWTVVQVVIVLLGAGAYAVRVPWLERTLGAWA